MKQEFEEIMETHADNFKWNDYHDSNNEEKTTQLINMRERARLRNDPLEKKRAIYLKFKENNDPEYSIPDGFLGRGLLIKHIIFKDKEYKYCSSKCEKWLLLNNYYQTQNNWDNLSRWCKSCKNSGSGTSTQRWKMENKQKIAEYNRQYRENNQDKVRSYYKKTGQEKQITINNRRKKYFDTFKELVEQKDGTCMGTVDDYETAHSKIKIKCNSGHIWEITLNNLKSGRWCSTCRNFPVYRKTIVFKIVPRPEHTDETKKNINQFD